MPFHALLGIIEIKGERFLLLVSQIQNAGTIYQDHISNVFRVKEAVFISFTCDTNHSRLPSDVRALLGGITQVLQQGMYFSYHYDLTSTLQRTAKHHASGLSLFDVAEKQYMWNYPISKEFLSRGVGTKWITPLIQGYVGVVEDEVKGKKLKLILISRRRHRRAGTRFNARGIDDEGNVANMVETEQIVLYNNSTYSLVQIRGSVPVFWTQTGVMAAVNLTRSAEMAFPAYSKHFDDLVKLYKRVLIVNLLTGTKEGEAKLIRAYEANTSAYEKRPDSNVRYCYFDFHQQRAANPVFERNTNRG